MTEPHKNHPLADSESEWIGLDLVCFSHLRWDYVWQRPHHLMSRAAQDRRVFYIEEPEVVEGERRMAVRPYMSNLWIATPHLLPGKNVEESRKEHIRLIEEFFRENEINESVFWYYTPMALDYSRHLHPRLVIYDCMDELSNFNGAHPRMKELENELLQRADLVFTGGYSLYEARRKRHPNVHAFPSSIDRAHFARARSPRTEPVDQIRIPHPRLGFFGVIDERIDLDLIRRTAETRPDWNLVLVGPVAKIDLAKLPQGSNIHYLGSKPYHDLPDYLASWDVALLPFAINPATEYISPTKTLEYLAGGKPVVSTPIRDVVRPYGEEKLVSIANGVEDFVAAVNSILASSGARPAWLAKVDSFLKGNSWDATWKEMTQRIESCLYDQRDKTHPSSSAGSLQKGTTTSPISLQVAVGGGKANHRAISMFDYLVVGAGFAGSVLAERLAVGSGKRVLLIDRRNHIGGNAYDTYNAEGLLIHQYGPHIFHTNSRDVFTYLSRFTQWRPYEHRVLASVDGQLVPIPINLDTINQLYGLNLSVRDLADFYASIAEPREQIRTSEDVVISKVGKELYEKFFRNYTRKQWDLDPSQLDASVTARVPIRMNRDGRYFTDTYQAMPLHGYTRLFEQMLDHANIKIMLNTDYRELVDLIPFREMIYTGPIDEYFDYAYGKLPYRSLTFKFETVDQERYQPAAVINYPNEHLFTRVTEFKYLTGQKHPQSAIVAEYPTAEGDPYYPIPRPENAELYQQYQQLATTTNGVYFAGRLATYKYYNMDQVVAQALSLYARISGIQLEEAVNAHTPHLIPVSLPGSQPGK
ncbi:MAG TPA: UDP-galactopyranose mutase [Anaerolineaceae bacterium]|nr:UDP-galactopyranose mutase [Anaerolineaceae bacterium]